MKKYLIILLALVLLAGACTPQATPTTAPAPNEAPSAEAAPTQPAPAGGKTLMVMAAASLTESFSEIGKAFEAKNPGVSVQFNFAGSQQLSQQLGNGAPADVFASANKKQMDVVIEAGRVDKDAPQTFVKNRLVAIYPQANPAKMATLKDLAKPGLKLVLAAKEVPVGGYSLDFLGKAVKDETLGSSYQDDVLKNVVSYEATVKAVLTKVVLGEADAGIVYTSDISAEAAQKVKMIDIPDALNVIATYPIAPVKDSQNLDLAKAFIAMVMDKEGQDILAKYGFIPVME